MCRLLLCSFWGERLFRALPTRLRGGLYSTGSGVSGTKDKQAKAQFAVGTKSEYNCGIQSPQMVETHCPHLCIFLHC